MSNLEHHRKILRSAAAKAERLPGQDEPSAAARETTQLFRSFQRERRSREQAICAAYAAGLSIEEIAIESRVRAIVIYRTLERCGRVNDHVQAAEPVNHDPESRLSR